ncbi:FAD-dependent oxidoreductase [Nocardioides panacisoli]|uniref:protoporphyrinogen/coproporphyrinogen oxidase n=1 Tax=Nocardioides panacisoli TaxID=627624 RepID=UPI001C635EE7|nr:FAD-dependent oxidoreductase [Nocardioides panacisoli]QYJ03996.1 FAD-dependent oxidoreductase [Nocardioides panacisoli]
MRGQRVIVVGGGIAGLTAAHDLVAAGAEVLLLEATDRVGGKLRRAEVAGVTVDVGAEAMLNRRPEGVDLAQSLGLTVVHPTDATSRLWTRDALRPLPRSLMGAPLDLAQLADSGVLSEAGLARAREEPTLPATDVDGDVSVGELVDRRFGEEVTDRLVEPLLGGVYAGRARAISVRAAIPALADLAARGSIVEHGPAPAPGAPVFAGLPGGMWRLAEVLAAAVTAGGGEVRTGATVRELRRTTTGFDVGGERADAVVVATPAVAAARLLGEVAPAAAGELGGIDHASSALVTLAFRTADAAALDPTASGFLVPAVDGRRIKAATYSFAKWDWVREAAGDLVVLRTSLGRIGEEQSLQVPDADLVAASLADLRAATGLDAVPVDAVVQRWGGGLPQYAVGHLDRVARIREAVAAVPGLAVCGAAYDGVGVPACIGSAHRAVGELGALGTMGA